MESSPDSRDSQTPEHPEYIGPYRITSVLGVGGMGIVYAAEQSSPIERRVAVKVIRAGHGASDVVRRFDAERQALAVMEHPSIAHVHDAGTTDQGMPYVVMEYVDGVPLDVWCDEHRLSTRERLRLFLPVCHAVQHAHQKGVIHRDLKPSNVLVMRDGDRALPKVIDFGIAKAMNRRLTNETLVTEVGLVMGTPAYMSPEQAEGAGVDVDTRTDVYALGVMLYELLTGTLPADPSETGLVPFIARLMSRLTVTDPPSARVNSRATRSTMAALRGSEPAVLSRELRGDLDAIVLKAISPERDRRYQTAQELAQDIERHLDHEPIAARAPSLGYRARKFARRHPTATALTAAAAIFLVGLTALMAVQTRRIAHARTVAEQRRTQAEELISYMVGDLREKLEPIGRLEILDDVGNRALAYFAAVPASELTEDELFKRSQALAQLGQVRMAQGNLVAAMKPFEESLLLARDLAARDTANTEWQVGLGASHFWVGYTHYLRSALDSALAEFTPYLEISRRLVERDSTNPDWQLELGYAHSNIGSVREAKGDFRGALESFRYTLGVKRRLVALDTANMEWLLDLGHTENTVGRALERLGELDSAEAHYAADLRIKEQLVARNSSNMTWRHALETSMSYAASVDALRGRTDEALAGYDSALQVARSLYAHDSTNTGWARSIGVMAYRSGGIRVQRGQRERGIVLLREGRAILRDLVANDSTNSDMKLQLAIAETELARALAGGGELAAAQAGLAIAERLLVPMTEQRGPKSQVGFQLASARLVTAEMSERAGDGRAARKAYAAALDALGPARAGEELRALDARAQALVGLDRLAEARPLLQRLERAGYRELRYVRFASQVTAGNARR